ncbi:MAG: hypothetical protein HFF17_09720 [Oscillospiraceae bacterium]|nr:hypothetical protein [Oscillospiraceae bacterium]
MYYIILAILIFGFLIIIHELGHFIAAKRLGVQVNEFAVGMGPVLLQRKRGETAYSLRALPVGGFCAMEGEDEELDNPRAFNSVAWWRRLIILAAGSLMNLLAGFLIVLILLAPSAGFLTAEITGFFDGGGLEAQGLEKGDVLYKIDGERVYIYQDVSLLLSRGESYFHELTVLRDGKKVDLGSVNMTPFPYEENGGTTEKVGLNFGAVEEKTAASLLKNSFYNSVDFARMVRMGLQDLLSGKVGVRDMSGMVGIVKVVKDSGEEAEAQGGVAAGVSQALYLGAFIAINLGIMNLLPIPALDGGRILCLFLTMAAEKILRRRIDPKYEGYLHAAGMVLLLGLMAVVTFSDVFKLFGK